CIRQFRLGALERYLEILGIKLCEYLTLLDLIVLLEIYGDDGAAYASSDGIDMTIDLSVIGAFASRVVLPKKIPSHCTHDEKNDKSPLRHRMLMKISFCFRTLATIFHLFRKRLAHGMLVIAYEYCFGLF